MDGGSITVGTGVLTFTDQPGDTETVVIGGKTYTFQATLTDSDGNVHIGADLAGSISNLVAAIQLDDSGESATGAGTDYAASMTRHPSVRVVDSDGTTLTVGSPGGAVIDTTETLTNASWGAASFAGTGSVAYWAERVLASVQLNSQALTLLRQLTVATD